MDVLSEVLRVVRLSGVIHFCAEFTHPWAFSTSPPEMLAARLKVPEGSVTPFHVCVEDGCWVVSGKLPPIHIETDDVIVFPRGNQHIMASDLGVVPVPIKDIYSNPSSEQITCLRYGGGGRTARFICGYLHSDHQFDPLLKCLPAVLCVRSRDGALALETLDDAARRVRPIEHQREAEWWQASVRYLIDETAVPGPGNRAVLARLAESLFVEVLRWELRYAEHGHGGWLAVCMIPRSVASSGCFMRSPIGRGPSASSQRRQRCRARRLQSALLSWSANRRFTISPSGACTWQDTCCERLPSASAKSRVGSDTNPKRPSIGRSGGSWARRLLHGAKTGTPRPVERRGQPLA
jgi:Cupin